jgi:hypothetical protein
MARLIVDAPESRLTLELTLDEAAVLLVLTGQTAGSSAPRAIYDELADNELVVSRAEQFKFTPADGHLVMRVDPR